MPPISSGIEIVAEAGRILQMRSPRDKMARLYDVHHHLSRDGYRIDHDAAVVPVEEPGRPDKPELVAASGLSRRRLGSEKGRAAFLHAIAHIEFNAMNLAADAVHRFRNMPPKYYRDWYSVGYDEAYHFHLLNKRLGEMGYAYGDFPAHDGLWEMAIKTSDSCLARMALVPRVMEARGLDVTPGMIDRMEEVGDHESAVILRRILMDEVRHVELGTEWFNWCCSDQYLDREETFFRLLNERFGGAIRGPLNTEARLKAGFTKSELQRLESGS